MGYGMVSNVRIVMAGVCTVSDADARSMLERTFAISCRGMPWGLILVLMDWIF
jgi:hypothetical protein